MTQEDYTPDFRALCAELLQPLAESVNADPHHAYLDLVTRARLALAQPKPQKATDEELQKLAGMFFTSTEFGFVDFARAVLTRWGK